MPGFILNVQGLEVLFKILEGLPETANPIRPGSIENALTDLAREMRRWVMSAIGIGEKDLPLPIVHLNRHSSQHTKGFRLFLEVEQKGGGAIPEFTL